MSKSIRFVSAAFLALTIGALAFGQSTTTGAIGGTVTNPNKEVVSGASVAVKNKGTNKEDAATTDDQGRFRVVNLDPGTYAVTINASGFSPYTQEKIVEVGRVTDINVELSVGPVQGGTVEITTDAPVINTSQQDFSNNMNQTSINELPINGQRWSNFALLAPGTVPDGNFGLISFRGISGLLNNNTVDGGDNNQAFFSEERGRTRLSYTTSQAAIREFQINTSNFSAEYGRSAGGVVNAVTKSGTNNFHGGAFYYQRNNKWGARNPLGFINTFNPATGLISRPPFKPEDVRHRFGATIGGPIKKDKAFFFFSYDEQRRNFPGLGIFSSPGYLTSINKCTSATDTTGGPGGVPCTSTLFGQSLKNPSRNLSDTQINSVVGFLSSLTGPVPRRGNQRIFLPKVDWHITPNHTLTGSYNRLRWVSPAGIQTQPTNTRGRASFGDDFVNGDTLNVRLSSAFGPNLVNEARFQWGRDNEFQFSQPPLPGEPTTAPAFPGVTQAGTRSPDVFLSNGIEFGTPTFLERTAFPDERRWQYADTVTLTAGNHTIKWGGDINHVTDLQNNLRNYAGAYSYGNINDFIIDYLNFSTSGGLGAGLPCSSTTRVRGKCYTSNYQQGFGPTVFSFATDDFNFFLQDDWRYTPRLTVNLGVRYEYERLPKPFLASNVPQTNNFPMDKNNIGPRIGFAWDMTGDGRNSLRGGYGLYYGRIINSTILNALTLTGNSGGQSQSSISPASSAAPIFPNTLSSAPAGATNIVFFQNHYQAPAIHQMDLIYEREIARNTVASGSLLMSFGRRLPGFLDINLPDATGIFTYNITSGQFAGQTFSVPAYILPRPVSAFGAMTQITSNVSSSYYGFVAQLNRRMTRGLQLQINYTRSKARDDGQGSVTFSDTSDAFDPKRPHFDASVSNFDIPNKFVANAVYQPPFKNAILKDWTISPIIAAYSGVPLNGFLSCVSSQGTAGGVNGSGCGTGSGYFGANNRMPIVPRNFERLPKIVNVDLRVSRRLRFNESTALELLAEGFNLFNRTQVTGMTSTIYSVSNFTFNAATATGTANLTPPNTPFKQVNAAGGTLFRERQVQLAVRFEF